MEIEDPQLKTAPLIVNCSFEGRAGAFFSRQFGDLLRWELTEATAPGRWAWLNEIRRSINDHYNLLAELGRCYRQEILSSAMRLPALPISREVFPFDIVQQNRSPKRLLW